MFGLNEIVIEEIIVHILGPSRLGLVKSDECLDRGENPEAFDIIKVNILKILKSEKTRKAKFTDFQPHLASGICDDAIRHPQSFIAASQKLAEKLYAILKRNSNIAECDLVVCLFHDAGVPQRRFIAILKLGLSYGLRNKVIIQGSNRIISFDSLHSFTFETLQKAAVVPVYDIENVYDLILVDFQTRPAYRNQIARFFIGRFMGSKLIPDDMHLTRLLYESLIDIENRHLRAGNYPDAEKIHELERHICGQKVYNLNAWMKKLGFSKRLMDAVNAEINPDLRHAAFHIHQSSLKKYCQRVKFKDSNGLVVQIPGIYLTNIRLPGKPSKSLPVTISLETEGFERVK